MWLFMSPPDNIRSYICDVSDYSQVQIIAKKIEEEVGIVSASHDGSHIDL